MASKNEAGRYLKYACYVIVIVIGLMIIVYLANALMFSTTQRQSGSSVRPVIEQTYPDIRVVRVTEETYFAGFDVRARIKAILYNYGTADGYAVVKLYTIWDTTRDEAIKSVFVPVKASVTVEADLDVPAFGSWRYGATVISQKKAS